MTGMRERAASVGGELTAGPGPERGFLVTACLPLDAALAEPGPDPDPAGQDAAPAPAEPPATGRRPGAEREGPAMIRVLLADDQALIRAGFRLLLDTAADIEVVGEASDGARGGRAGPRTGGPTWC